MRATCIAVAALGGIVAAVFAFANIGQYFSGTVSQVSLTLVAAVMGALPGLILLLASPRRRSHPTYPQDQSRSSMDSKVSPVAWSIQCESVRIARQL
jgi:hypothetical protein